MNDHLPFLKAIREQPGEEFPLQIYADYLEEQGDPRARFLRGNRFCPECLGQGVEPWLCPLLPRPDDRWECPMCEGRVVDLTPGQQHRRLMLRWRPTSNWEVTAPAALEGIRCDPADGAGHRVRVDFYIETDDWRKCVEGVSAQPPEERSFRILRGTTVRLSDRGLTTEDGGPIAAGSRLLEPGGSPLGVAQGPPQDGSVELQITAPGITVNLPPLPEGQVVAAPVTESQPPSVIAAELNRYAAGLQRYVVLEGVTVRPLGGEMRWAPGAAEIIEDLYRRGRETPAPPAARPAIWYEDVRYCDHCQRDTPHEVHDSGHERDSSGDWRECLVCHWRYSGLAGRYSPS